MLRLLSPHTTKSACCLRGGGAGMARQERRVRGGSGSRRRRPQLAGWAQRQRVGAHSSCASGGMGVPSGATSGRGSRLNVYSASISSTVRTCSASEREGERRGGQIGTREGAVGRWDTAGSDGWRERHRQSVLCWQAGGPERRHSAGSASPGARAPRLRAPRPRRGRQRCAPGSHPARVASERWRHSWWGARRCAGQSHGTCPARAGGAACRMLPAPARTSVRTPQPQLGVLKSSSRCLVGRCVMACRSVESSLGDSSFRRPGREGGQAAQHQQNKQGSKAPGWPPIAAAAWARLRALVAVAAAKLVGAALVDDGARPPQLAGVVVGQLALQASKRRKRNSDSACAGHGSQAAGPPSETGARPADTNTEVTLTLLSSFSHL